MRYYRTLNLIIRITLNAIIGKRLGSIANVQHILEHRSYFKRTFFWVILSILSHQSPVLTKDMYFWSTGQD